MNFMNRIETAYDCLNDFKNRCDNENIKQLIDIFFPMFCQDNEHNLTISIGRKISEEKFDSWMTTFTHKFIIVPSCHKDEPQLIFRDRANRVNNNIAVINLALINKLHIKVNEEKSRCFYDIDFNYNNQVDYTFHLVVNIE